MSQVDFRLRNVVVSRAESRRVKWNLVEPIMGGCHNEPGIAMEDGVESRTEGQTGTRRSG